MRILRYGFVGGCAAVVDFALFAALTLWIGVPWFFAAVVSFLVATAVNYFLSIRLVFKSGARFSRRTEWAAVLAVSAVGLVLNQIILWGLIERAGVNILVSKVIATGCVFLWNYGIRHYFVFAPGSTGR